MRRIFTLLAVLVMAGTFAAAQTAPVAKQTEPKAKAAKTQKAPAAAKLSGTIVSADATTLTVKGTKGEEKFALTADTKIQQGAKTLTAADLTAGAKATVTYTKAGDTMTATKVVVSAPKPAKAAKTPKAAK
jgi:hypothetical protein